MSHSALLKKIPLLFICLLLVAFTAIIKMSFSLLFGAHLPLSDIQLAEISTAFYFGALLGVLLVTFLGDFLKAKYLIMIGLLVSVIGGLLVSFGDSFAVLALGRFLIGLASLAIFLPVLKLGVLSFSRRWFVLYAGIMIALPSFVMFFLTGFLYYLASVIGIHGELNLISILGAILFFLSFFLLKDKDDQGVSHPKLSGRAYASVFSSHRIWLSIIIMMLASIFASRLLPSGFFSRALVYGYHFTDYRGAMYSGFLFLFFSLAQLLFAFLSAASGIRRLFIVTGSLMAGFLLLVVVIWVAFMPPLWLLVTLLFVITILSASSICCYGVIRDDLGDGSSACLAFGLVSLFTFFFTFIVDLFHLVPLLSALCLMVAGVVAIAITKKKPHER